MVHAHKVRVAVAAVVAAASLILAGCSSSPGQSSSSQASSSGSHAAPLKVAFIYNGSITDGNWTQRGDQTGRVAAQKKFGDKIQTTYLQNIPQGPAATTAVNKLVQQGYKLFFLNSAGYETYMKPIAAAHPDVRFEEFEGSFQSSNYGVWNSDIAQATYIAGMMLASASKTGKIGMVNSFPFPGIITQINGLTLGARAVNPNATVQVIFVSSFFDPSKETLAAQGLISNGVDAIANGANDPAACVVAQKQDIPCMAQEQYNGESQGPSTYLASYLYIHTPAVEKVIQLTLDGKPVPKSIFMGWKDGAVGLDTTTPAYEKWVDASARAKIAGAEKALSDGTLDVHAGPIKDQNGTVRVPAGKSLTPDQILSINWGVQGIIGDLKPGS